MVQEDEILKNMSYFENHEITVLRDTYEVQRFKFAQKGTWMYGFHLTTAENLIVMTGDCFTLVLTPGYNRCGLKFLLGSVKNTGYFLSKCPYSYNETLSEYDPKVAKENIAEYVKDGYLTQEQADEIDMIDESGMLGEFHYYEGLSKYNIDDIASPKSYTSTTMLQLAGLTCFADKYRKQFFQDEDQK